MDAEGGPPEEPDEDYLRDRNPVFHKGLLQTTMGAPQPIYYGGLVLAQIRHFDPDRGRPGLPDGVSALVTRIDADGVTFRLVNDGAGERTVVVQAGAYGEHTFDRVEQNGETGTPDASAISVTLPSDGHVTVTATLDRYSNDPSYGYPWE
jgi:hypothetical protein